MTEPQHQGRCIVFPAVFEGSDEMSHLTLKYLGTADTMEGTQDQVMQALYTLRNIYSGPEEFFTSGTDFFGEFRNVLVMRISSNWLKGFHRMAERILADEGVVPQESTWEYEPHVTLPDEDMEFPKSVTLHPPVLWWEDERPVSIPWTNNV